MALTEFGEDHTQHTQRTAVAFGDLTEANRQSRRNFSTYRTTSSTRLLNTIVDIELEAAIKTNPDSKPEERDEMLAILKIIQESEKNK